MEPSQEISDKSLLQAHGRLFIVSAPSGAGKTTLCQALLQHFPDMCYSISHTTRPPRSGETPGIDYHYISRDEFLEMIAADRWAEWAEVHGNYYGTSADFLNRNLEAGKDILLDIDVQGMQKIIQRYPSAVTLFIQPPSLETLRIRLESRDADRPDIIELRMKNAIQEMAAAHRYRHTIVNDDLRTAIQELIRLVTCYRPGNPHHS